MSPVADPLVNRGIPFILHTGKSRREPSLAEWRDHPIVGTPAALTGAGVGGEGLLCRVNPDARAHPLSGAPTSGSTGSIGSFVQPQHLNQLCARSAKPALDRADPHLTDRRCFLVRETARADEREHFALLGRKLRHSFTEILEVEVALLVAGNRKTARIKAIAVLHFSGSLSIIRVVDVAEDREQPGPQASSRLEPFRFAPRAQEGFLDQVVGHRNRAGERNREGARKLDPASGSSLKLADGIAASQELRSLRSLIAPRNEQATP